ncbi:MAG: di-trans,poly-cis-decaprenylcistransferase, partial [Phycisphaerales bacterium]|nr:di-trans,poly-cis-decaprenylcistransferase [Phycisphaerales bacterium]
MTTTSAADVEALEIAAAMRRRNPKAEPLAVLPDVHPSRIPRHIAIIMDGNGRWATQRGLARMLGHRAGAKVVRAIVEHIGRLGVECLTLYSFSLENWKRPKDEVEALMALYLEYMDAQREEFMRENIRFRQIGLTEGLPRACIDKRDEITALTKNNTAGTLVLAVNYGSRAEITAAARALARRAAAGTLGPADITEDALTAELDTAGLPDPVRVILPPLPRIQHRVDALAVEDDQPGFVACGGKGCQRAVAHR